MTVESNITFNEGQNIEDKILVTPAFNIQEGGYMSKTSMLDIAHNKGNIIYHPTISGLIKSGQAHLMTKGRIRIIHKLNSDVTPEQIQNIITYYEGVLPNVIVKHEPKSNSIHIFYHVSYTQESFINIPPQYSPIADESKMLFSEGSNLICFLRIDDDPDAWTVEYRDITSTATINKQGSLCYVIFSTDVTVGNKTLIAAKPYKMTSDSLDVTVSENTKVVRLYLD